MLEIKKKKKSVTEIKNPFDEIISRLDKAEERHSEPEDINRILENQKAKKD